MTEKEWLVSNDPARMLQWVTRGRGGYTPGKGISDRKLRLFACACVRQVWSIVTERSRNAVEVAERYADGMATLQELMTAHDRASKPALDGSFEAELAWKASQQHAGALSANNALPRWFSVSTKLASLQATLLRTIVGNPWRPVTLPEGRKECSWCGGAGTRRVVRTTMTCLPCDGRGWFATTCPWLTWKDGTIPKMTQVIYDERMWDQMPMLADALEESGCRDEVILRWCRGQEWCWLCTADELRSSACPECHCSGWIPRHGPSVRGDWVLDLLTGRE